MTAKYEMLDALGISQHHDAITGTSTKAVADDYIERLFLSMDNNKDMYSLSIQRRAESSFGLEFSDKWT